MVAVVSEKGGCYDIVISRILTDIEPASTDVTLCNDALTDTNIYTALETINSIIISCCMKTTTEHPTTTSPDGITDKLTNLGEGTLKMESTKIKSEPVDMSLINKDEEIYEENFMLSTEGSEIVWPKTFENILENRRDASERDRKKARQLENVTEMLEKSPKSLKLKQQSRRKKSSTSKYIDSDDKEVKETTERQGDGAQHELKSKHVEHTETGEKVDLAMIGFMSRQIEEEGERVSLVHGDEDPNINESVTSRETLKDYNTHVKTTSESKSQGQSQALSILGPSLEHRMFKTTSSSEARSRKFTCTDCGKEYGRKHHLERHMQQHTGNYKHWCPVCGKAFNEGGNLKEHLGTHQGTVSVCQHCGQQFKSRAGLKMHLPKHTGKYPLNCNICHKGFVRRSLLEEHMNKHDDQGVKYICEICSKEFKSRTGLQYHLNDHTGKYPHYCRTCNKGFTQKNRLEAHENEHEGKGFTCPMCLKMYYAKWKYENHIKMCKA